MQLWFSPTDLFTKLKPLHWSPTTTLMIKTQYCHKICRILSSVNSLSSHLVLLTAIPLSAATTLVMSFL